MLWWFKDECPIQKAAAFAREDSGELRRDAAPKPGCGVLPSSLLDGSFTPSYHRVVVKSIRLGHRRYVLSAGVNTVGREPTCTLAINDPSVSRAHARITVDGDQATIEDLNSKNGTQVMGVPVSGPTLLRDGDEIEFGHVKGWYIVEADDDPPTTTHL